MIDIIQFAATLAVMASMGNEADDNSLSRRTVAFEMGTEQDSQEKESQFVWK